MQTRRTGTGQRSMIGRMVAIEQISRAFKRHAGESFDRIPEKPVMDGAEEADAYDEATRNSIVPVHRMVVRMASALLPPTPVVQHTDNLSLVADFGSGPAAMLVKLAQTLPHVRVVGSELSDAMIAKANKNIRDAALDGRVRVVKADCTQDAQVNPATAQLSTSVFVAHQFASANDVVSMLKLMGQLTATTGSMLLLDFLRPPTQQIAEDVVAATGTGNASDVDYKNSLLVAFSLAEWQEMVAASRVDGLQVVAAQGKLPLLVAIYRAGELASGGMVPNSALPPEPGSWKQRLELWANQRIIEGDMKRGGFPYF